MSINQVDAIFHPIRIRILITLAERQLTARELLILLGDIPQATLYRHINILQKAGFLQVVEERSAGANLEKVYGLSSGQLTAEDLTQATNEDHMRFFSVFVTKLLGDFNRYLSQDEANPLIDGAGYRQVPLYLNEEELLAMTMDLNKALLPYLQIKPEEGRRRRIFTTILIPEDEPTLPPQ